jgi:hypothetical protein
MSGGRNEGSGARYVPGKMLGLRLRFIISNCSGDRSGHFYLHKYLRQDVNERWIGGAYIGETLGPRRNGRVHSVYLDGIREAASARRVQGGRVDE